MDTNSEPVIDEEAIAEEEFIADVEDVIGNPLVYNKEEKAVQETTGRLVVEEKEKLVGAIGTGGLAPESEPFNNENALRSESVNNNESSFGADSGSEKAFGGPENAPLDNATETIAPSVAPEINSNSFGAVSPEMNASSATNALASGQGAPMSANEPTIEQLANATTGTPQTTEVSMNQASTAATNPVVANGAAKKSKKGLVIGIVVGVLLLAAIIGGVIFYNLHESKERKLSDAISGIWNAEARQFDGKMTVSFGEKAKSDSVESMTLVFKSDNKAANFSGSGDLTINFKNNDPLNINVSGAYISGDSIFVKLDNLKNTVKNLNLGEVIGADGDDTEKFVKIVEDVLVAVAEKIDGTWYKINADTFSSSDKAKESYECLTKALNEMSSSETKGKVADIYKAHPFVVLKDQDSENADGLTYYYVDVNKDESKAFSKDVEELNVIKDLKACSDSGTTSIESDNSVSTSEKVEAETNIKLGISGWSHELRAIKGTSSSKDVKLEMDIKISYDNKDVVAPTSDAINIADAGKDLLDAATKAYKEGYLELIKDYCKENSGGNSRVYQYCYDEMEKQMNQSLRSFLGNLGGSIIKTSVLSDD